MVYWGWTKGAHWRLAALAGYEFRQFRQVSATVGWAVQVCWGARGGPGGVFEGQ